MWTVRLKKSAPREEWPAIDGVLVAHTPRLCREALGIIRDQPVVGVDTETYGCQPKTEHPFNKAFPLSIQFAGLEGPRIFVPLWSGTGNRVDPKGRLGNLEIFREWLADKTPKKAASNTKWDMHALANVGFDFDGLYGDSQILDFLWANGEQHHALKVCMRRYFNEEASKRNAEAILPYTWEDAKDYDEVFRRPKIGKLGNELKTNYVPDLREVIKIQPGDAHYKKGGIHRLITYAVKDPFFSAHLVLFLQCMMEKTPWVKEKNYWEYYKKFERPYTRCLFDIEREGCPIDLEHLRTIAKKIRADVEETERAFLKTAVSMGVKPSYLEKFNIGSNQQVADLLYRQLGAAATEATRGGGISVAREALELLRGRPGKLAGYILRYRKLDKLEGTYIKAWIAHAESTGKGRLHTNLKQTGAATGRLSSATHNLQNVPKSQDEDDPYRLREAFVAPDEDTVVGDIDLSQIEVRLTAHKCREKVLLNMLENGHDQHLTTACIMFEEVREALGDHPANKEGAKIVAEKLGKDRWENYRRAAKVINFGIIYGMGPQGYARKVGCSDDEGKEAITKFFEGFPDLQRGINEIKRSCKKLGYVRTLLRRYCQIPGITSPVAAIRGASERQAFNYVIQGSAADMLKMGMLLVWGDERLRKWDVRMTLQIHDELTFLIPKVHVEKARPIIEDYISHPYRYFGMKDLLIDTPADLGIGSNWNAAKNAA
jgi:DNA polymerase I-like protein with 3'-5' exonuclease and polymerase domains